MARAKPKKKPSPVKARGRGKAPVKPRKKAQAQRKVRASKAAAPESAVAAYVLPENCDTGAAEQIRIDLLAFRGKDVEVDASGVRRVGVLGLQVLLSATRSWSRDGRRITILHPCAALTESLSLLGLGGELANSISVSQ